MSVIYIKYNDDIAESGPEEYLIAVRESTDGLSRILTKIKNILSTPSYNDEDKCLIGDTLVKNSIVLREYDLVNQTVIKQAREFASKLDLCINTNQHALYLITNGKLDELIGAGVYSFNGINLIQRSTFVNAVRCDKCGALVDVVDMRMHNRLPKCAEAAAVPKPNEQLALMRRYSAEVSVIASLVDIVPVKLVPGRYDVYIPSWINDLIEVYQNAGYTDLTLTEYLQRAIGNLAVNSSDVNDSIKLE